MGKKRYEKSAVTAPKKRQVELLPAVDINTYRHSYHDLNLEILNTSTL